ncbi:MAG: hypothetical protein ACLFPL_05040 [Candidatus Nanoarchaeia archaeon]
MVDILGYIVENFAWIGSISVLAIVLLLTLTPAAQADETLYSYISAEINYCSSPQQSQPTFECVEQRLDALSSRYEELYVQSDIGREVEYVIYNTNDETITSTNSQSSQTRVQERMNSCLLFTSCTSFYFNSNEGSNDQYQVVILP